MILDSKSAYSNWLKRPSPVKKLHGEVRDGYLRNWMRNWNCSNRSRNIFIQIFMNIFIQTDEFQHLSEHTVSIRFQVGGIHQGYETSKNWRMEVKIAAKAAIWVLISYMPHHFDMLCYVVPAKFKFKHRLCE